MVECWSWVAGLAYLGCGNSWRPQGCSALQSSAQYAASSIVLHDPWTDPSSFATRALVVYSDVPEVPSDKLSAGYDHLIDVVNVVMPSVWGWLFSVFSRAKRGTLLATIGTGGHYVIAAALRILSGLIVRSLPR